MKYSTTLLAVSDMERSKKFYHDVLDLEVTADFGANVILGDVICLQTKETWADFIHKNPEEIVFENNATELYFEEEDIASFMKKLDNVRLVHPLTEHPWGQYAVRFYDPDMHIIEVGECLKSVIKRFMNEGMSLSETAVRMDVSEDYINSVLVEEKIER